MDVSATHTHHRWWFHAAASDSAGCRYALAGDGAASAELLLICASSYCASRFDAVPTITQTPRHWKGTAANVGHMVMHENQLRVTVDKRFVGLRVIERDQVICAADATQS